MEKGELILKITIPEYLREIQVSKEVRPKYYYWDKTTIAAKGKKLLQKYIDPDAKERIIKNNGNVTPKDLKWGYHIVGLKGNKVYSCIDPIQGEYKINDLTRKQREKETKYVLCEADSNDGEFDIEIDRVSRVIANDTKVGKPRMQKISGQDMYSGNLHEHTRVKLVNALKEHYYKSKFKNLSSISIQGTKNKISQSYPVYVEMEIVDTIKDYKDITKEGVGRRWDVGNRAYPYLKTFVDFLVNGDPSGDFTGFLEDDDRLRVSGESHYFTPCKTFEERALVFYIYKDDREIWKNINQYIT